MYRSYNYDTSQEYAWENMSQEYHEQVTRRGRPCDSSAIGEVFYEYKGGKCRTDHHHVNHKNRYHVPQVEKKVQYVEYEQVTELQRDGFLKPRHSNFVKHREQHVFKGF